MAEVEKKDHIIKKIGIVVEPEACFGAECDGEGGVRLIENGPFGDHDFEYTQGYELEHEAGVKGFTSMLNAGIAVSDIGIALRRISRNALNIFGPEESVHAVISMPSDFPMVEQIEKYMKLQKRLAKKDSDCQFSIDVYDELELENLTSYELLEKAAEYAGIEKYMVVFRPLAIAYAYEYEKPETALAEGQRGLIYDWGKNYFSATIVEKTEGQIDILWSETIESPAKGDFSFVYHINEDLLKEQKRCFEKTLDVIHEMCGLSGYYVDTISAVYLAGEYSNIPEIAFELEDIIGDVYGMEDNRLAAIHGVVRMAEHWSEKAAEEELENAEETDKI